MSVCAKHWKRFCSTPKFDLKLHSQARRGSHNFTFRACPQQVTHFQSPSTLGKLLLVVKKSLTWKLKNDRFCCMPLNNYSFSRTAIILSLAMMSSIVVAGINLIFLVSQVSTCHWRVWQEFLRLQSKVHFNQGLISPICLLLQLVIQLRAYFNNPFISWWLQATGHYLDW